MGASDIVEMNKRPQLGGGKGRLNVRHWVCPAAKLPVGLRPNTRHSADRIAFLKAAVPATCNSPVSPCQRDVLGKRDREQVSEKLPCPRVRETGCLAILLNVLIGNHCELAPVPIMPASFADVGLDLTAV